VRDDGEPEDPRVCAALDALVLHGAQLDLLEKERPEQYAELINSLRKAAVDEDLAWDEIVELSDLDPWKN